MKGVSFQNGVEYKILIEGESWDQGATLNGKLETVVRGSGAAPSVVRVILAEGSDKKVQSKTPGALKPVARSEGSSASVLSWSFPLALDAPITDKTSSLYIVYGAGEALESLGQLRLNILPHIHLRDLVDVFVMQFRFALKNFSAGKNNFVEVKLDPPSVKDWASLEQVLMKCKVTEKTLDANFIFTRQQVNATVGSVSSKTIKIEVERSWPLEKMVHDFNQRLNKDKAFTALEGVIAEYREAGWIS